MIHDHVSKWIRCVNLVRVLFVSFLKVFLTIFAMGARRFFQFEGRWIYGFYSI